MSKRAATVQLTSDNIEEQNEKSEEAGAFAVASQEEIHQRVIKKAKRGWNADQESGGIFSKLKQSLASSSQGKNPFTSSQGMNPFSTGAANTMQPGPTKLSGLGHAHPGLDLKAGPASSDTSEYLHQLASLNNSVSQWINRHVASNPYVDLTPVFKDYETHLRSIDSKSNTGHPSSEGEAERESPDVVIDSGESDGSSNAEAISVSDSTPRDSPIVQSAATPTPPPGTTPSEDDSLLSLRAKLYYKKAAEYIELGVGLLKVRSSSKGAVQLLMRNETSLGSIMLNVKVSGNMPVSSSKKSVLVVCPAPNPPLSIGAGPVTYLVRVKTDEFAEQLLHMIQDNVKQ